MDQTLARVTLTHRHLKSKYHGFCQLKAVLPMDQTLARVTLTHRHLKPKYHGFCQLKAVLPMDQTLARVTLTHRHLKPKYHGFCQLKAALPMDQTLARVTLTHRPLKPKYHGFCQCSPNHSQYPSNSHPPVVNCGVTSVTWTYGLPSPLRCIHTGACGRAGPHCGSRTAGPH